MMVKTNAWDAVSQFPGFLDNFEPATVFYFNSFSSSRSSSSSSSSLPLLLKCSSLGWFQILDLPAFTSQVLKLQTGTTIPGWWLGFVLVHCYQTSKLLISQACGVVWYVACWRWKCMYSRAARSQRRTEGQEWLVLWGCAAPWMYFHTGPHCLSVKWGIRIHHKGIEAKWLGAWFPLPSPALPLGVFHPRLIWF